MLRQIPRAGSLAVLALVVAFSGLATSCGGGGGGYAAKDMVLLEFLFVDRALVPAVPTGTKSLPRNAQILMVFSEQVNPATVDVQTIQIRYGPSGQSVPQGSFSVDGNRVRFDPTVTAQGQPNPFGFQPVTPYTVRIPNFEEQQAVVRNLDNDPNLVTFLSQFTTSDGYLRELIPPEVRRVFFVPDPDPLTGQIPGGGIMGVEFSEPMDPASFRQGGPEGPVPGLTAIDLRYKKDEQVNLDNGLVVPPDPLLGIGVPVPGFFTHNPGATIYYFNPMFSFGDKKYVFTLQLFQGLKDLSGNLLVNPRSFGPYTCDGSGRVFGTPLTEDFLDTTNYDVSATSRSDADWGFSEEGVLQGQDIETHNTYAMVALEQAAIGGQFFPIVDPLIGAAINNVVGWPPPGTPPSEVGRRVLWAFTDREMGPSGTVTGAAWGPDSNATFAAIYPQVFLRCGHQSKASINLSGGSFSGNYDGDPTIVYSGSYTVTQAANIGDTDLSLEPNFENRYKLEGPGTTWCGWCCGAGCAPCAWCSVTPSGFYDWPDFTTLFDWDEGTSAANDSVFLFDASVDEGDTWQQIRGWMALAPGGLLIPGYPNRRMYATFEEDVPNPPTNLGAGILNPEPSLTDTAFTITKRVSFAQTLFYTDAFQPSGAISNQVTYGLQSDYLVPQLEPATQAGGAQVGIEFQACNFVEVNRRSVNALPGEFLDADEDGAFDADEDWTNDIDDCDGFRCIRWRIRLVSNLISNQKARLTRVVVPVVIK